MNVALEAQVLATRLWLGLANSAEIDDWLDAYVTEAQLQSESPNPDALSLFELNGEQLITHFMTLVAATYSFEPQTERGSQVTTVILARVCQQVLAGDRSVPDMCRLVSQVDAKYTDPELGSPLPRGLHELWNGCDWCDESWSLDAPSHLRELLADHIALANQLEFAGERETAAGEHA